MYLFKVIFFAVILAIFNFPVAGQPCAGGYFSLSTRANHPITVSQARVNNATGVSMCGALYPGPYTSFSRGLLFRLSPAGSPLWSRMFSHYKYNTINIRSMIEMPDGGLIILVNAFFVDVSISQVTSSGDFLMRTDQYGQLQWVKMLTNQREMNYFGISRLSNGNIIVAGSGMTSISSWDSPIRVYCLNESGNVLWSNKINIPDYFFNIGPNGAIVELKNNQLLLATHCLKARQVNFDYIASGYAFINLRIDNGQAVWHRVYTTQNMPGSVFTRSGPIRHAQQSPDGRIHAYTSVNDTTIVPDPPGFSRAWHIELNEQGQLIGTNRLFNSVPGAVPVSGMATSGNDMLLFYDGIQPILGKYDFNQKGMVKQTGLGRKPYQIPAFFQHNESGFHVFLNDNTNPVATYIRYIKTDTAMQAPCEETTVQMVAQPTSNQLVAETTNPFFLLTGAGELPIDSFIVSEYPLQVTTDCRQNCCTDKTDSIRQVTVCTGNTYTLPNGYAVADSGLYSMRYPMNNGCDSLVYYNIRFPARGPLQLGNDTCFFETDTIWLEGPPGYDQYQWSGGATGNQRKLAVTRVGNYRLSVTSACTNSSDEVEVLPTCDFDIFIPGIFTPNSDGVNDRFGIDNRNKNHLVRFSIYNRWGQLVFTTGRKEDLWDGTLNGKRMPTGAYVYYIEMQSFDRKRTLRKKGTVILSR
jgi:gliding motility-associated-like protein